MRFSTSRICAAALTAALGACSVGGGMVSQGGSMPNVGGIRQPVTLVPDWLHPVGAQRLRLDFVYPEAKSTGGIYGSEFFTTGSSGEGVINGYPNPNNKNHKPTCSIAGYAINGWGVDAVGNLILPANLTSSAFPLVNVFKGPGLCGKLLGSITDSNGQAADAKSFDATKDKIYVGEITSNATGTGDIVICTLKSKACGSPVTNSSITGHGAGVAIDSKGDCWMSAGTSTNTGFVMVYWKGCKGKGVVATGTKNAGFGGLFFDTKGNLVSVDVTSAMLYVYKGCTPKCTVVSSSALKGASLFGNLNAAGNELAVADIANSQVDVYKYAPSGVKYMYSFNNGLSSKFVIGAGFNPTNKQL